MRNLLVLCGANSRLLPFLDRHSGLQRALVRGTPGSLQGMLAVAAGHGRSSGGDNGRLLALPRLVKVGSAGVNSLSNKCIGCG
jgi:hypothetical protein